jgi:hypothetical protein
VKSSLGVAGWNNPFSFLFFGEVREGEGKEMAIPWFLIY